MRAAAFHQIKFLGLTPGRQRWFDRLQKLVTRMHQAKEGRPGQKRVGLRQRVADRERPNETQAGCCYAADPSVGF